MPGGEGWGSECESMEVGKVSHVYWGSSETNSAAGGVMGLGHEGLEGSPDVAALPCGCREEFSALISSGRTPTRAAKIGTGPPQGPESVLFRQLSAQVPGSRPASHLGI